MKPGDKVKIVDAQDPWFGCTGVIVSLVMFDKEITTLVRVANLSDHSQPKAVGIWDISNLKTAEQF
jgi:hypothetical protein